MKDIITYINESKILEARLSDKAAKPFESKEELMAFIDEIEKTKLIVKKYDDEAQKYWDLMAKASKAAEKEFDKLHIKFSDPEWSDKWHAMEAKHKVDEYMAKAEEILKTPECVEANKKLYDELQQRALDSLSPKEQKAIGKRGGRLFNVLNEVMKKYMKWDFKKNCPVE